MQRELVEQRLMDCFEAVFPALSREQILSATPESVAQWDSIATVTLASVIEEEFGTAVEFDMELSFAEILSFLRQRGALA